MVTCLRDMVVQCSHKGCANDHPLSDWIKTTFQQMEPMPDAAQVAKNLRLDRPWLRGKSNIIVLLKERKDSSHHSAIDHCLAWPSSEKLPIVGDRN